MSSDKGKGAAPVEEFGPMDTRSIKVGLDDHGMSAADLVEAIFRKVRQSVTPPVPIDNSRKLFGMGLGEWVKIGIFVAGAAAAVWRWTTMVDDGMKARPTRDEMQMSVQHSIEFHTMTPGQHQGIEAKVNETRESQIRTEEQIKAINSNLQQIKITVRR